MDSILLGWALCAGLVTAAPDVEEGVVVRWAIAVLVPRESWNKMVWEEVARQGLDDCKEIDWLMGPGYEANVVATLVNAFVVDRWDFEQMLHMATGGQHGLQPYDFQVLKLGKRVGEIGQSIPRLVQEGVWSAAERKGKGWQQ